MLLVREEGVETVLATALTVHDRSVVDVIAVDRGSAAEARPQSLKKKNQMLLAYIVDQKKARLKKTRMVQHLPDGLKVSTKVICLELVLHLSEAGIKITMYVASGLFGLQLL